LLGMFISLAPVSFRLFFRLIGINNYRFIF
jgi:hypothetical protein